MQIILSHNNVNNNHNYSFFFDFNIFISVFLFSAAPFVSNIYHAIFVHLPLDRHKQRFAYDKNQPQLYHFGLMFL